MLQPGQFVTENLRVISFLGSGGMSHVYKCQDVTLSRVVAVKTLRAGFSDDSLRRFQTEGKAIASLEHPNIVKLYGLLIGKDFVPILTMEFVDGISLASLLEKEGALSVSRSLRIALQIAEGLTAAQKQAIIHRDLKPANIMIVNAGALDEKVKILDFGIAKIQNEMTVKATQTGDIFGTPQYMSPEQAMGKKCDGRTDQYSLGCVLFEMLCGHPPFQQDSMVSVLIAHAQEQAPPLSKSMKHAPSARLQALVSKLLQKNLEERYDSMDSVSQAIFRATTQSGAAPGRMIGVGLALVAIVAAVCLFNFRGTENRVVPGQSLASKSSGAEKIQDEGALPQAELNDADKFILNHQDHFIVGDSLNLKGQNDSDQTYGESLSDEGLARLVRNKNLTKINLRKCRSITSAGVGALRALPVTSLDLGETSVDDDAAKYLCEMSNLRALNLDFTEITSKTCQQIASLTGLTDLGLRSPNVNANALPYLASMKHLNVLDLSESNVAGSLRALKDSSVQDLALDQVKGLTPADFEQGISQMRRLRALRFDHTDISNVELQKLARLKDLIHIRLFKCMSLTPADILEFHAHCPMCLIDQDKEGLDDRMLLPAVKQSELIGPNLIKNGDFEDGAEPAYHEVCVRDSKIIPEWIVLIGSIDWVNKRLRAPASGANSISLNASNPGTIVQHFMAIPGRRYCVQFKAAACPSANSSEKPTRQRFIVGVNDQSLQYNILPSKNANKMEWRDYTWIFTATIEETPVKLGSCEPGKIGPFIDLVSVKQMAH